MKNKFFTKYFFLVLLAITLSLGFCGFYFEDTFSWHDAVYKTLQLFTLGASPIPEYSTLVNIARFLAPCVLLFGGTQLTLYIFQEGWNSFCLRTYTNHIVIIGYGNVGQKIKQKLKEEGTISDNDSIIIVDPLLMKQKFSLSEIMLKQEADENLLKKLKINKASKIIIATDNDYINLKLRESIKDIVENITIYMRIQSLKNLEISDNNTKIYKIDYPIKIHNIKNHLVVVLGAGTIGRQIIEQSVNNNKVIVIEQSNNVINVLKDEFNDDAVCYKKADVGLVTEKDIDNQILKQYKKYKDIIIYICLGGDWLGLKTVYYWSQWLEKKKVLNIKICLFGNDISQRLLNNCNISKKVELKNIHEDIVWIQN